MDKQKIRTILSNIPPKLSELSGIIEFGKPNRVTKEAEIQNIFLSAIDILRRLVKNNAG